MPVAGGTARHGSKSVLYPGNGDTVDFERSLGGAPH